MPPLARPLVASLLALAAGLAGCGPCPTFGEMAIEGGSSAGRGTVREAIATFAGWTGREGVCVGRVRVLDELDGRGPLESLGGYHSGRRLIEVLEAQPNLADTTIHEMCHAVEHHDAITRDHGELFTYDTQASDYDVRSARSREREAVALLCEAGPEALAIAASVAPVCHPEVDVEAVEHVLEAVYPDQPSHLDASSVPRREPVASWELPAGWSLVGELPVAGSLGGELIFVVEVGGAVELVAVDPDSGVLLDEAAGDVFPPALLPPPPTTYLWEHLRTASFADGAVVAAFRWRLASGETIRPLVYHDGDRWLLPEEPCATDDSWFVQVEGRPWLVELDGRTVRWSRLVR